ncbi:TFIIB-type zinc ribbon-containing protein [Halovulum sp. GXIMD14793]
MDGEVLVVTERSGVEIDYCPRCRGVWLDRGELEKIIDRSAEVSPSVSYRDDHKDHRAPKKRKSSMLKRFEFTLRHHIKSKRVHHIGLSLRFRIIFCLRFIPKRFK